MGIMEKKTETTIMGYIGYRRWGILGDLIIIYPKQKFRLAVGPCARFGVQRFKAFRA